MCHSCVYVTNVRCGVSVFRCLSLQHVACTFRVDALTAGSFCSRSALVAIHFCQCERNLSYKFSPAQHPVGSSSCRMGKRPRRGSASDGADAPPDPVASARGSRQRLRAGLATLGEDRERHAGSSALVAHLLCMIAWGDLSFSAAQSIAYHAMKDGADHPDVLKLAKCGTSGTHSNHIKRDVQSLWPPSPLVDIIRHNVPLPLDFFQGPRLRRDMVFGSRNPSPSQEFYEFPGRALHLECSTSCPKVPFTIVSFTMFYHCSR